MFFRLYPEQAAYLLALPETGMGYQIIDAHLPGIYRREEFIVYNSELAIEVDNNYDKYKAQMVEMGFEKMYGRADYLSLKDILLVKDKGRGPIGMASEATMSRKGRHSGGKGSVDNNPVSPKENEIFVRLSAYKNDRRVDVVNGRIIPGTYTTTEADYLSCKTHNDDPLDRYALPNDEKIQWAFHLKPERKDQYRPGIVQPAFNHLGGGIEALFDNGTSDGTLLNTIGY